MNEQKTNCFSSRQIGKTVTINSYVSTGPMSSCQLAFNSGQNNVEYEPLPDFKIKPADISAVDDDFIGIVIDAIDESANIYGVAEKGSGAIICVQATIDKNAGEEVRISIDESKFPYLPAGRLTNKPGTGTIELTGIKWNISTGEICIEL